MQVLQHVKTPNEKQRHETVFFLVPVVPLSCSTVSQLDQTLLEAVALLELLEADKEPLIGSKAQNSLLATGPL